MENREFYLVEWRSSECDNSWLCSSVAEANDTIAQKLGEFAIDCLRNDHKDTLEDFIQKLKYDELEINGVKRISLYTPDDDIFITKLELHNKEWN